MATPTSKTPDERRQVNTSGERSAHKRRAERDGDACYGCAYYPRKPKRGGKFGESSLHCARHENHHL